VRASQTGSAAGHRRPPSCHHSRQRGAVADPRLDTPAQPHVVVRRSETRSPAAPQSPQHRAGPADALAHTNAVTARTRAQARGGRHGHGHGAWRVVHLGRRSLLGGGVRTHATRTHRGHTGTQGRPKTPPSFTQRRDKCSRRSAAKSPAPPHKCPVA
jgi:hypothetical protein